MILIDDRGSSGDLLGDCSTAVSVGVRRALTGDGKADEQSNEWLLKLNSLTLERSQPYHWRGFADSHDDMHLQHVLLFLPHKLIDNQACCMQRILCRL